MMVLMERLAYHFNFCLKASLEGQNSFHISLCNSTDRVVISADTILINDKKMYTAPFKWDP